MLALLLYVQILGLLHPQRALVDGVEAQAGHRYGGQRFTIEVGSLKREYSGRLLVEDAGTELRLINEVDLEDYVASVVAAEQDGGPLAAREALAIVVRSFAIYQGANERLCDTTHCQWYRGLAHTDIDAARHTRGEVLLLKGHVPPVFYSADCGGHTKKARDVWPGASQEAQEASLRSVDTHDPGVTLRRGHGVGLCQRGALFLASKGASAHQILARYFPGLRIGRR
jgi:stage II sporulation protein D